MNDRLTVDTITSTALDALQLRAARMEHATKQAAELAVRLEDAERERDGAYRERAQLLTLLAALHPSVIAPAPDVAEDGWQILYLRIGGKQASWHIAPRDAELYAHVEHVPAEDRRAQWDGHTTEQKYAHIGQYAARLYAEARGRVEAPANVRMRALYEQWVKAGPPPLGTSMARWWDARLVELHDAIRPPAEATEPIVDRPFRSHRQEPAAPYECAHGHVWKPYAQAPCSECLAERERPHSADPVSAALDPDRPRTKYQLCRRCTQGTTEPIHRTPKPVCTCTYGQRCPNCRD